MVNEFDFLGTAAIGGIITLLVRELFAWKFIELERKRKRLTDLFEKVYGPIRVVMWRIEVEEQEEKEEPEYFVVRDEYLEIRRITYLYQHEFDQTYSELLDFFLEEGKGCASKIWAKLDSNPNKIFDLIAATETKYNKLNSEIKKLSNMRNGFFNNIKFILFTWRF